MDGVLTPSCAAPRQPEALADIARDASIADALAAARELLGMERAYLAEAGEPAAEGHLAVPVRLRDGTVYGSLCCVPRPAAPELERPAEQMLEVLARVIADQIEHQLDRRRTTRLEGEAIAGSATSRSSTSPRSRCCTTSASWASPTRSCRSPAGSRRPSGRSCTRIRRWASASSPRSPRSRTSRPPCAGSTSAGTGAATPTASPGRPSRSPAGSASRATRGTR